MIDSATDTVKPAPLDRLRLEQLRESLPALRDRAYLNTGTAGPMPKAVADAMRDEAEAQLSVPRSGPEHGQRVRELKAQARQAIASMFHCDASEVALTHNTTEGMNLATLSINWHPGDEAVTTNIEHPGVLFPLYAARERFNITIKTANVSGKGPEETVAAIRALCSARTKLISLSHVSFTTGQVLPIREIAAVAHRHGALLLVDGAQSFAAIPLHVRELGCDLYAVSGQKWLCGPEGTGALYAAQDVISQTRITFAAYGTMEGYNDYGGYQIKANAQRFEQGTANATGFAGQASAAHWLASTVGLDNAYRRTHSLADYAIRCLSKTDGVTVLTPPQHAGLVSARVDGVEVDDVVSHLREQGIMIRSVRSVGAVRLSLGFFNTEEEIERAANAISAARSNA